MRQRGGADDADGDFGGGGAAPRGMQQQQRRAKRGGGSGAAAGPGPGARIDALLAQDGPLDEHEQQQLIMEFEDLQVAQARAFRGMFGGGAALGAALCLYAAWLHWARPWEQRYTGELRTVVSHKGAGLVLLAQAAAHALAAAALLVGLPQCGGCGARGARARDGCMAPGGGGGAAGKARWVALSAAALLATGAAAYWVAAIRASAARHGPAGEHYDLLWLPLLPLALVGLCCYVMRSVAATAAEVDRLRRMTYDFKKV